LLRRKPGKRRKNDCRGKERCGKKKNGQEQRKNRLNKSTSREWQKQIAEEAEKKVVEQTLDRRAGEMEEGEILEDQDTPPQSQDGKDKVRESLRIDTTTPAIGRRRHPGLLDLEEAKKSSIAGPQSALATARIISDILSVPYPEGVSSPNSALNQNAKEGKFWCVIVQHCN
jgi:translation initiation factor 4G